MAPERLKLTLQFGTENLRCRLRTFTARFRLPLFHLAHVGVIISPRLFSAHRKFAKIAIQISLYQNYIAEKVVLRKIIAQKRIAFLIS